jgi:hypothetical protein
MIRSWCVNIHNLPICRVVIYNVPASSFSDLGVIFQSSKYFIYNFTIFALEIETEMH